MISTFLQTKIENQKQLRQKAEKLKFEGREEYRKEYTYPRFVFKTCI